MPASGVVFAQIVLVGMVALMLLTWGILTVFRWRTTRVMLAMGTVFAWSLPFLFFWRTAVYGGTPAYGDVSLGWPFIYTHAQSDSGLSSFHLGLFVADLLIGVVAGLSYLLLRRYCGGSVGFLPRG